eukprot:COSAG02_NODE_65828_length_257_cov_0.645570_1_plen_28_part_10
MVATYSMQYCARNLLDLPVVGTGTSRYR